MTVAIWLLWVLLALALTLSVFEYERWEQGPASFFVITSVVVVLGFIMLPSMFESAASYSRTELGLYALSYAVDLVVVYLLFTRPGALWFRFRSD